MVADGGTALDPLDSFARVTVSELERHEWAIVREMRLRPLATHPPPSSPPWSQRKSSGPSTGKITSTGHVRGGGVQDRLRVILVKVMR
jgi:hypothetical protein